MKYIKRNKDGVVTDVYARKQFEGQEALADDHPEIIAFFEPPTENAIEAEIEKQIRKTAIQDLKTAGKISADYPEPEISDVSGISAKK